MKKIKTAPNFLQTMKVELLKKKEQVIVDSKKEFSKHVNGEFRDVADSGEEDGNGGVRDVSEDISLGLLGKNKKLIIDINEALIKISKGTYGVCEECGDQIPEKRLLVNPSATLCVTCQEEKEITEKREN